MLYNKILLTKTDQEQAVPIEDYAKTVLEKSELSNNSVKSIVNAITRLNNINLNNIFTYRSVEEINEKICPRLNALKKKSTDAFRPFISHSTKSLCHSMGNPLKAAEDVVEYKDKDWIINSLLKIVTLLSYRFALAALHAVLLGECQYPEISSFVFDEDNSSASYRKEIAHMARYYRLHLGSFLAIEFAKELGMYRQSYNGNNNNNKNNNNRFESVIELYEAGCVDYIFNFVIDSNKREEKLVTPVLMYLNDKDKRTTRRVLGIHIYGDEEIRLWKRWGDPYDRLMDISGNQSSSSSNITMEVTPFSNALAVI
jgi:hypothetical protein